MSQTQTAAPSTARIALALGIVGLVLGAAALGYAVYLGLSQFPSQISAVSIDQSCSTSSPCATENIKVEWETALNSGQDRFYPNYITVIQGDNLTITFITNDTSDGHSLELPLSIVGLPSSSLFILNNSWTGLTSGPYIGYPNLVHPAVNGIDCCLANGGNYNPQDNFTGFPTGCQDRNGNTLTCNTQNAGGTSYRCDAYQPIETHNATNTKSCSLWSSGYLGVVNTPGEYKFFCFYHQSVGMFGYLTVLPNKGFTS
jgi:plastocyanin